ncbi:hypothetical protein H0H93_012649 [Arthromyces matolae]|nr:hypothetical protein H0H93_012649 [Arthromyces matolae]
MRFKSFFCAFLPILFFAPPSFQNNVPKEASSLAENHPEIKLHDVRSGQVILVNRMALETECRVDKASEIIPDYQLVLVWRKAGYFSAPGEDFDYVPIAFDRPNGQDGDPNWISLNNEPLEPLRKALEGRFQGRDLNDARFHMDKLCPLEDSTSLEVEFDLELRDVQGGPILLEKNHADKIMELVHLIKVPKKVLSKTCLPSPVTSEAEREAFQMVFIWPSEFTAQVKGTPPQSGWDMAPIILGSPTSQNPALFRPLTDPTLKPLRRALIQHDVDVENTFLYAVQHCKLQSDGSLFRVEEPTRQAVTRLQLPDARKIVLEIIDLKPHSDPQNWLEKARKEVKQLSHRVINQPTNQPEPVRPDERELQKKVPFMGILLETVLNGTRSPKPEGYHRSPKIT